MKKKKEKKQSKKLKAKQCRNLKEFMDSSDEDFYQIQFNALGLFFIMFLAHDTKVYEYSQYYLCTGMIDQG